MSYCPYCGRAVDDDMSFCPNCGAAIKSEIKSYQVSSAVTQTAGNYKVYLVDLADANRYLVIDLLEDVMGYTTTAATNLVNNVPVQIADNLTLQQAAVVAQAFEEYGVELTVTNGDDYEDISAATSSSSIFNSDGSFMASAAIILATLGASNRLRGINKPRKPSLLERLFMPLYRPACQPVHIRRNIRPRNMDFRRDPQPKKYVRQQIYPSNNRPSGNPARDLHAGGGIHGAISNNKASQNRPQAKSKQPSFNNRKKAK